MKDAELWLKAHHGALSAKLPPNYVLTKEERDWALDQVRNNDEADERERAESRCAR